jgi:hypothetical protein
MKTAMQELIEYLNGDTYAGICDIRDRAEELLEGLYEEARVASIIKLCLTGK